MLVIVVIAKKMFIFVQTSYVFEKEIGYFCFTKTLHDLL